MPSLNSSKRLGNLLRDDFFIGFRAAAVASLVATFLFKNTLAMAVTVLAAFWSHARLTQRLDENRQGIWEEKRSAWLVNGELTVSIVSLFLGALVCFLAYNYLFHELPTDKDPSSFFKNDFKPLVIHNLRVLLGCYILCLFYSANGLLLVLLWNAFHWASSFVLLILYVFSLNTDKSLIVLLLRCSAVLPHLLLEATGFVLAGLAGLFLSKACARYKLASSQFFRVSRACVVILLVAALLITLAAKIEISFAQHVLRELI